MPSTPSATCTNAPNFWMLVTGPSTTEPTGNFCAASAQGSPSACLRPSEMRRSGALTPSTTTSTVSPGLTTSEGLRTFLDQDISERCTRPSMPFSSSTKAPKSVTRVTLPLTRSPALYLSATRSTVSPGLTTSEGLRTFLDQDISERCTKPSMPFSSSTKAPKSVTRVTLPLTRSPALYLSATRSQGCGWSCLSPREMRFLPG